jgi:predicted DCC family thiol-disulfide oxidoreductase YuxK
MTRGLMLNDADCGFCMRTAALVPRLGVDIDASTIQAVDLDALGVDADRAQVEMPYVHPDGRVDYGHRAFAAILRTGPLPWRVVGRLMTTRPVDPVARRAYHWVAANRSRLPGGTASCAIEPR